MENLPVHVSLIFVGVSFTVFMFLMYAGYRALDGTRNPVSKLGIVLLVWLLGTGVLANNGFFLDYGMPPRLFLFVGTALLIMIFLFVNGKSRAALMNIPITTITHIHIVRIPVELCLWWLSAAFLVDIEMTFDGSNFDILAGISAPFAGIFLVGKKSSNKIAAIIWNFICLGLVLNIVIRAIGLTPYFYDGSGDQLQNIAVFHFPFIWLPAFVVPAVIFSHILSLIQLMKKSE